MNAALIVAAGLVVVYGAIAVALWHFQERIVFQPPRRPVGASADGIPRLDYAARDGTPLIAHVVGAGRPGVPPILAFHGNAVVARWMIPWALEVARRFDTCVVLPEYRGYDGLTGSPTYEGAAQDAAAALAAMQSRLGVEPSGIVFFGHSLGSAVAAELAAISSPRALVLQSPFTSARDMVARWPVVGFRVGWALVSRVHYDTTARVRRLSAPVHVVHGERDLVIPAWMGRAVYAAATRPAGLLIVSGAAHNDVPDVGGVEYWRWLQGAVGSDRG